MEEIKVFTDMSTRASHLIHGIAVSSKMLVLCSAGVSVSSGIPVSN
jgi:NAD-dependent SIR2 family protein deacetylase